MKAITIYPEWCLAIVELGKNIENRSWKPPMGLLGERIAIHAGARKFSKDVFGVVQRTALGAGYDCWSDDDRYSFCRDGKSLSSGDFSEIPRGRVVATAILESVSNDDESVWAIEGYWHWRLSDVKRVQIPLKVRGQQRLWDTPSELDKLII